MKNLKVKFAVVVAAVCALMLSLALVGCGGGSDKYADSKYLGTWSATTASMSGISVDVKNIMGGEFTFELSADGKCKVTVAGDSDSGSWEETSDGFCVEKEFNMVVDGDNGVMDYDGLAMNFEHVK